MFAVVRDQDGHAKEHVQALLQQRRRHLETKLRVVSDGEDGMRSLVGKQPLPAGEVFSSNAYVRKKRQYPSLDAISSAAESGGGPRVEEHLFLLLSNNASNCL